MAIQIGRHITIGCLCPSLIKDGNSYTIKLKTDRLFPYSSQRLTLQCPSSNIWRKIWQLIYLIEVKKVVRFGESIVSRNVEVLKIVFLVNSYLLKEFRSSLRDVNFVLVLVHLFHDFILCNLSKICKTQTVFY